MSAKKKWTAEQMQAINSLDGTVLVSAAAGSGKTSVLIERVLKRISDPENPVDINKLLIVTFTNAAADEMKERLSIALSKIIQEHPENEWLRRQEILLQNAKIGTIDSFCSNLLRNNFQQLQKMQISIDFRILEEKELLLLKNEALVSTLNEFYKNASPDFIKLSEVFNYGRDDQILMESIDNLYKYSLSHPFPELWLSEKIKFYQKTESIRETIWAQLAFSYAKETINCCKNIIYASLAALSRDEVLNTAYKPGFELYKTQILKLDSAIDEKNWDKIYKDLLNIENTRLKTVRNCENLALKENIKINRAEIKKNIENLKKLFYADEKQCLKDLAKASPIISELFKIFKVFKEKLDELKREKNVLEFADLLHVSLKLLYKFDADKTDKQKYKLTDFAKELQKKFVEIIVDEYQDINDAQELLFKALSQDGKNMFMVGDAKQSIYRFRQASPKIFIEKSNKFNLASDFTSHLDHYPIKVYLSKNFRSGKNIINAVNFFFSQLMTEEFGNINYEKNESLVFAAEDIKSSQVELNIFSTGSSEDNTDILEARIIAKKIKELISQKKEKGEGSRYQFSDICILLRSLKGHADVIKKELNRLAIPTICEGEGSFFSTSEISILLSLLRVIDNPLQDIPLASIMLSPIYNFTADDLARIRIKFPNDMLYFSVKKFAEKGDDLAKKCQNFLEQIKLFRYMSENLSTDRFINKLLDETKYTAIVSNMAEGGIRLANIHMFVKYAHNYEKTSFKGLHAFINYINNLQRKKADLQPALQSEMPVQSANGNFVKIMSIHKSKGLEFPVCILANLSRKFHLQPDEISLNTNLGLAVYLRDELDTDIKYPNLAKLIIQKQERVESLSEELRVLYVAMTRAKERLILICSEKNIINKLKTLVSKISFNKQINPEILRNSNSYSDWILLCSLLCKDAAELRRLADFLDINSQNELIKHIKSINSIKFDYTTDEELEELKELEKLEANLQNNTISFENHNLENDLILQKLRDQLNFKYAYEADTLLPSKISASEFSRKQANFSTLKKAKFLYNDSNISKHTISGADRGTAMHKFMEYANYYEANKNIANHLRLLTESGFLSKHEASLIDLNKLKIFFSSDLYSRMCKANNIFREYRFSFLLDPKELRNLNVRNTREKIILQGAVDCIIEENSGIIIVDYKTDVVKSELELQQIYSTQLKLYKKALESIFNKTVNECILYSFYLNKSIVLDSAAL